MFQALALDKSYLSSISRLLTNGMVSLLGNTKSCIVGCPPVQRRHPSFLWSAIAPIGRVECCGTFSGFIQAGRRRRGNGRDEGAEVRLGLVYASVPDGGYLLGTWRRLDGSGISN